MGWIAIKFCTNIIVHQRMNSVDFVDFVDSLHFNEAPPASQNFLKLLK